MTTPLHAALGQIGTELTMSLLRDACAQQAAETDQLDFKVDLPLPAAGVGSNDEARARSLELAKDLAAMANSRGGMLVFGVRDEGDRAAELRGVPDISDGVMEKRIRQVGYNMVYPPVQVRCHPLVDDGVYALVVEVPESDDAPHLVQPKRDGGNDGWLMAPYRSGSDTLNMVEKQLEAAYRQRIDGRRLQVRQLRELHEELAERHIGASDRSTGTVVVLARPQHPRLGLLPDRDPARYVHGVVQGALVFASQIAGELRLVEQFPISLLAEAPIPRRGLRRHVLSATRRIRDGENDYFDRPVYVALEIHDNGTIGLVWRRGPGYTFARRITTDLPTPALGRADMDVMSILMAALIVSVAEDLGLATDYGVRAAIVPSEPFWLIPDQGWTDGDYPLVPVAPVLEAELRTTASPDVRAMDFLAFGQDLANMVEERSSVLERFWELPTGTRPDHPRRILARHLFGGEPDHPTRGTTMA
jgi:hypothetical protein